MVRRRLPRAHEVQKDETLRFTIHGDRTVEIEIDRPAA